MAKICPDCGSVVSDDPKFCPACGASMADAEIAAQENIPSDPADTRLSGFDGAATESIPEKRVFVLRRKKYGDTLHFEDAEPTAAASSAASDARAHLSLYLSVFALVLSVIAVTLVIIFAILPTAQRADTADTAATIPATAAPTQAPTEPPITGMYQLSEIRGEDLGLMSLMLGNSTLQMHADYTGAVMLGSSAIGELTLDKASDAAVLMNSDCAYTFDGKVLTIDYLGRTLVYKKEM